MGLRVQMPTISQLKLVSGIDLCSVKFLERKIAFVGGLMVLIVFFPLGQGLLIRLNIFRSSFGMITTKSLFKRRFFGRRNLGVSGFLLVIRTTIFFSHNYTRVKRKKQ